MWSFWLLATLMLVIGLGFVVIPFVKYKLDGSTFDASSDWFKKRQQELEQEMKSGLFSEQEYQQALTELKITAKEELTTAKGQTQVNSVKQTKLVLGASLIFVVLIVVFYAVNGHYKKLEDWQQTLLKMPELSQKVIKDVEQQVTPEDLQDFALGLRSKLAEKEDHIGWMLLGRVLMSLGDLDGALPAFEKSYNMQKNNVSNTVSFAQALQAKGETWDVQRSLSLLQEAMIFKPDNELAIILFGEGHMALEDFEMAKKSFEIAKQMISPTDVRVSAINQRLDYIESRLQSSDVASVSLAIKVTAIEAVNLEQFQYLFVFAKTDQMPMPIAVKKIPVSNLPVTLELTDIDMMLPEQSLNDYSEVNLFARLSKDEQASFIKGEWQGQVLAVSTQTKELIQIQINEEHK